MRFTGNHFKSEIYHSWERKLKIPIGILDRKGTFISVEEDLDKSARVIVYQIKDLLFIRVGVKTRKSLDLPSGFLVDELITPTEMKKRINTQGFEIIEDETLLDFFLDPKDFEQSHEEGQVRQLDKNADMEIIQGLFSVCSPEDLDEALIYIDNIDPYNFGIFENGKLIAYSSFRMFGENICDPGVLVHPQYRAKGLGKAVISALCEYCFINDIIPMYRVFEDNISSKKIPQSLGFQLFLKVHMLKLNKP